MCDQCPDSDCSRCSNQLLVLHSHCSHCSQCGHPGAGPRPGRYNGDGGAAARPPHPSQFSDLGPDYPIINVKIDTYNSYWWSWNWKLRTMRNTHHQCSWRGDGDNCYEQCQVFFKISPPGWWHADVATVPLPELIKLNHVFKSIYSHINSLVFKYSCERHWYKCTMDMWRKAGTRHTKYSCVSDVFIRPPTSPGYPTDTYWAAGSEE